MLKLGVSRPAILAMALFMLAFAQKTASAEPRATEFKLSNGMDVVVIPDHRAPVVTHMVWYKVGAADEPKGVSGIAHFLEHLMFKSTDKIAVGDFSKIISKLGGQDNAFTGQDVTAYHQRIAKDQLRTLMEMEADRMTHLRLTNEEVATERQVIIEERRSRIDNNPGARLDEQMNAALYLSHPYGVPVIGWAHEMARLSREDAMRFYKRYYAPNNAILVVAGDVTPEEVKRLAEETYGKLPANPEVDGRTRPQEPPHIAARRLTLKDPRAGNASFHRYYVVPSYVSAKPGEAEALDLLMKILADGSTSRLYRKLVVEDKVAATTGGDYSGYSLDSGAISLYAVANNGNLDAVEADVDKVLDEIRKEGVTQLELERAKKSLLADYIYDSDNQANLARRYGWAVAIGRSIAQVESWPAAISEVTIDDIKNAADTYLDARRSVTGWLLPEPDDGKGAGERVEQPVTHTRS
ncbi:MAG: insulinase family protein [Hyphomicrobium sp.]|uniref:M16 family metallopeptidase n=1 Tax=Hyphomicrobium sp. TaxID=82 RepID=UPI001320EB3D|nr:pitrilysin family protein [Hyphomicrobium sp.]KAB2942550.1 MAG: insulinase family protein [Hyphomicrobium sp.]MBZ0208522.1 insulinase family protein [Hyphomicrobium sp.]MCZ7594690.1 insulinase family protein [Hyphomicrobium sp.]